jgi:hypothetical protein
MVTSVLEELAAFTLSEVEGSGFFRNVGDHLRLQSEANGQCSKVNVDIEFGSRKLKNAKTRLHFNLIDW